jgi:hypothetical protein
VAPALHDELRIPSFAMFRHRNHPGATMNTDAFEPLTAAQLAIPHGGLNDAARWIMMRESGGSTTAGHLHFAGRGDGTPGNHSSAFGAFQMIEANRKRYMGADYQSTDFSKQYAAASRYVTDRYGSWEGAQAFWQKNHWY